VSRIIAYKKSFQNVLGVDFLLFSICALFVALYGFSYGWVAIKSAFVVVFGVIFFISALYRGMWLKSAIYILLSFIFAFSLGVVSVYILYIPIYAMYFIICHLVR